MTTEANSGGHTLTISMTAENTESTLKELATINGGWDGLGLGYGGASTRGSGGMTNIPVVSEIGKGVATVGAFVGSFLR